MVAAVIELEDKGGIDGKLTPWLSATITLESKSKPIDVAIIVVLSNLEHQGIIDRKRRASLCMNTFCITRWFMKFSLQKRESVKKFKMIWKWKNDMKVKC